MKLKDFVRNTLVEVEQGIKEANEKSKKEYWLDSSTSKGVHFDLAVVSEQQIKGNIDAGIKVLEVGVKGELKASDISRVENRVKFNVIG